MEHECSQEDNIKKLFDYHEAKIKQLHDMEVRQTEIMGDVKHIKTRIDNGMSHTLAEMHKWLAELKPQIEHHATIVKHIECMGWWIAKAVIAFLVTVLIGVSVWAIASGWKP